MRFEEALSVELETIPALMDKVLPLVASTDQKVPYIAYSSNEGQKLKTLSGYIDRKNISAVVNIVAKTYPEMKQLVSDVMDKLIGFQSRQIGDETGPFIQDVNFPEEPPPEVYDTDSDLYRSTIPFQVYL